MILCMWILLFSVFGFLWYCVDVLIDGGTVSLPKHFISKWFMFQGLWPIWNLHFLIIFWYMWYFVGLYLSLCWYFCTGFCVGISEEDALLVQYVSCTMCIFLRNTGKHDMCSGQKSDIVWCYIFRSYCSSHRYGAWTSTAVLTFFFYISYFTEN